MRLFDADMPGQQRQCIAVAPWFTSKSVQVRKLRVIGRTATALRACYQCSRMRCVPRIVMHELSINELQCT
jgi:hypothetical protein